MLFAGAQDCAVGLEFQRSKKWVKSKFARTLMNDEIFVGLHPQARANCPYHAFEYDGRYFVYHFAIGECINVSRQAYECLIGCEDGATPTSSDPELGKELARLKEIGFFNSYTPPVPDDKEFERLLEGRYSSPWTKLELALAETCNLACKYCYCGTCRDEIPNQGLMRESVARQAINGLFAVSGKSKDVHLTLFGGEPLLNKDVFMFAVAYTQKLARLHGKTVTYSMTTNGTLLDDEVITIIKKYNFGLMVSLDGPKELHNGQCPTRGGEGSYDLAVEGIKKLMARRTMAHPAPNMMKLVRFFEDFGFTRIVLGRVYNPVYQSCCDLDEKDFVDLEKQMKEEVVPWMLSELKAGRRPKYFPFSGVVDKDEKTDPSEPISPFRCGACRGTTTVGADGTMYPCHRFVGMKNWIVGSVENGPDIEKCKDFWRKYREFVKANCFACWAYPFCHGPCPWEVAQSDGTFKLNKHHCEETMIWFKHGAWFESLYNEMKKFLEG